MALTITLPRLLQRELESAASRLLRVDPGHAIDFTRPVGEPALAAPSSVSWRIFKNPVTLFLGGVAAVVLELAEPRIRSAIWERSSYRRDPLRRIRRTGLAAMTTVYGARSVSEPMIAQVARMHAAVSGVTDAGERFVANEPALLTWVHTTAAFGFLQAYREFASPLSEQDIDRYYAEGCGAARLYGCPRPPQTRSEIDSLLREWTSRLQPSSVIRDFLETASEAPAFPMPLRGLQRLLARAAVELIPSALRERIGLQGQPTLRRHERFAVAAAAKLADRIVIQGSSAVQACRRMGLPVRYLYD